MLKLKLKLKLENLSLLAQEIADAVAVVDRLQTDNQLLAEEQSLAAEIYAIYAAKERLLRRYADGDNGLLLCRGVRVIIDNEGILLRLRKPLPFPLDFQPSKIQDVIPEFECHLRDLISRNRAHKNMPHIRSEAILSLASTCDTAEELLDKASEISYSAKMIATKYAMSEISLRRMLKNNEAVI